LNDIKPQVNNLFLIGAGFTKAVFPDAPLNKDLFNEIVLANPKTKLNLYSKKYSAEDFEILLTRLDLEIAELKSKVLKEDRKNINEELAEYFQQFRFGQNKSNLNPWLEKFACEVLCENDAIVTTNYDCLLEGLLDFYKVWLPKGGYVNAHDPRIQGHSNEGRENPKRIKFYKIHGSEHFRECKVFGEEKRETGQTIIGFIVNESIYPISGKNSNIGWVDEVCERYIIAPSFVKIPHFQIADMINKANDVAKTAQNLVIIGSSLRNEDIFLRLILTGFMNYALQGKKKLITVDPNADFILKNIENFWIGGAQYITFHPIPKKIEEGLDNLIELL